jgi:hypothetical protein
MGAGRAAGRATPQTLLDSRVSLMAFGQLSGPWSGVLGRAFVGFDCLGESSAAVSLFFRFSLALPAHFEEGQQREQAEAGCPADDGEGDECRRGGGVFDLVIAEDEAGKHRGRSHDTGACEEQ